ncbi:MAG: hypothetical protein ACIAQZ_09635 [Sedimentisphaeraceae bacterium JB056]
MFDYIINRLQAMSLAGISFLILVFACVGFSASGKQEAGVFSRFHEIAQCKNYPQTKDLCSPARNDVSIRTLKFRPEADVFTAMNDFYATRLDWVYFNNDDGSDQDNIARVESMDIRVGGTCNGELGTCIMPSDVKDVDTWRKSMGIVDLNGEPIVFAWKTWAKEQGLIEGDTSNPAYFDAHLAYMKKLIDKGCTSIQRDEPGSDALAASRYGGGFSPSGVNGFRLWLKENVATEKLSELGISDVESFDYKQYLIEAGAPVGVAFNQYDDPIKDLWLRYWDEHAAKLWQRLTEAVKEYARHKGVDVQLSCNNTSLQLWGVIQQQFDFCMSELMAGTAWPGHLHNRSRVARSLGKHQMFNCPKISTEADSTERQRVALTRKVIATAYSLGHTCQVPWDKWNSGNVRYFGKPEDYADIYGFIRVNNWSVYCEVGAIGPEIEQRSPELEKIVSFKGGNGYVYGFLNLDIDDPTKPVLLFMVDWGKPLSKRPTQEEMSFLEEGANGSRLYFSKLGLENINRSAPESFSVCFDNAFYAEFDDLEFSLLQPQPYDEEIYKPALIVNDYSAFAKITGLKTIKDGDGRIIIDIPALNPWAILKVSKK